MNKLYLFIIVLIVLIGAGGLYLNKNQKTANWKTYTNNTYGFSFQYPPELLLSEDCVLWARGNFLTCLQSSDFIYAVSDGGDQPQESTRGFGIFINQDETDYPYDILTLQKNYKRDNNNVAVTTIHTIPTLKVTSEDDPGEVRWVMVHNKNVYSILSPFNTQEHPIVDQIISTFTFAKQNL